jgi:hypothetical protein
MKDITFMSFSFFLSLSLSSFFQMSPSSFSRYENKNTVFSLPLLLSIVNYEPYVSLVLKRDW